MGGEVLMKKRSGGERKWEVGESEEERRWGRGGQVGKGGGLVRLSSSAGRKTRC